MAFTAKNSTAMTPARQAEALDLIRNHGMTPREALIEIGLPRNRVWSWLRDGSGPKQAFQRKVQQTIAERDGTVIEAIADQIRAKGIDPLDHFAEFCESTLILDNRKPFVLEDFQRTILRDMFAGKAETLCILPKKQGKTTLIAALALYHLYTTQDADCIVVAASRDQAEYTLRQAHGFIRRSTVLTGRFKFNRREISNPQLGGSLRIRASDVDTVDGWLGTLGLVDELHRHKDKGALYGVIRDGLGARDGQMITISTAGSDANNVLWRMREAALDLGAKRDGAYLTAGNDHFVLHEWSLEPDQDLDDLDLVKTANPLAAMTIDKLRERRDSASMVPWQWARFACNVWTAGEEAWLPIGVWANHAEPGESIPEHSEVWLGVDLGLKHDSAAITAITRRGEDDYFTQTEVLTPPGDGRSLDIGEVEKAIRDCAARWDVQSVAYDPWRFERSAQMLGDEGLLMIEHPMTNARMAPESEALYEAIMRGHIHHNGDPVFTAHVNAGVPTETERGWRLTKRKAKDSIDALIGLLMAYDLTQRVAEPQRSVVIF